MTCRRANGQYHFGSVGSNRLTFYKTLFARMGNIKAGKYVSDEGEDLNDVEKVLGKNGINLRDQTNEFRNFGDVLDEVASKWENYDSVTKRAIATSFAGTRQQEKFFVLMENYGQALEYEAVAANAAGTANQKYTEAYLDSIEARRNATKAAFEGLSQTVLNSDLVKLVYTILTGIISALNWILSTWIGKFTLSSGVIFAVVKVLSKVPAMIAGIGTALTALKIKILGVETATRGAAAASNSWNIALLAIAAVAAIVGTVVGGINERNAELLEQNKNAVSEWKQGASARSEITKLYERYKTLNPATAEYKEVESELSALLKDRVATLRELTPGTKAYGDALKYAAEAAGELSPEELARIEYSADEVLKGSKHSGFFSRDGWKESFSAADGRGEFAIGLLRDMGFDFDYREDGKMLEKGFNSRGDTPEVMWNYLRRWDMYNRLSNRRSEYIQSGNIEAAEKLLHDEYFNFLGSYAAGQGYGFSAVSDALKASMSSALSGWREKGIAEDDVEGIYQLYSDAVGEVSKKYHIGWAYDTLQDTFAQYFSEITGFSLESKEDTAVPPAIYTIQTLFDTLADADLSGATESVEALASAIEEMDGSGKITLETAKKLVDMGKEYVYAISIENGELRVNTDFLRQMAVDKYEAAKATAVANGATQETIALYDMLIQKTRELGSGDALNRANSLLDYENAILEFAGGADYDQRRQVNVSRQRDNVLKQIEYLRSHGYSSDSEEIMSLYKQYIEYTEKMISLNKDLADQEEDELKDAIEAENDELEKQKDLFDDIIEARKKALDLMKEENSYQKELAEKQKAVGDLQTQLAAARLDTSASGRARVRQLEEQLANAQSDLDDFNLEHAVDVISDRLDAEKEENEALYEKQKADNDARLDALIAENKVNLQQYETYLKEEVDIVQAALGNIDLDINDPETGIANTLTDIESIIQTIEGKIGNEPKYITGDENVPILTKDQITDFKIRMNRRKYHSGGIVDDLGLGDNEVFAKLMKGEYVATPTQMSNFLRKTLPSMTAAGGQQFNAPLIAVNCESVNEESLPKLETIIKSAADRIKAELTSAFDKTGFRSPNKRILAY